MNYPYELVAKFSFLISGGGISSHAAAISSKELAFCNLFLSFVQLKEWSKVTGCLSGMLVGTSCCSAGLVHL